MDAVMLKRGWPCTFRRFIRDEAGNVVRVLSFEPGMPVELNAEDYAAVKEHIGKALTLPRVSEPPQAPQVIEQEEPPQIGRKRQQRK